LVTERFADPIVSLPTDAFRKRGPVHLRSTGKIGSPVTIRQGHGAERGDRSDEATGTENCLCSRCAAGLGELICKLLENMEPRARVELATCRLRIGCSTTELPRPFARREAQRAALLVLNNPYFPSAKLTFPGAGNIDQYYLRYPRFARSHAFALVDRAARWQCPTWRKGTLPKQCRYRPPGIAGRTTGRI
jgi:hypothetical protein